MAKRKLAKPTKRAPIDPKLEELRLAIGGAARDEVLALISEGIDLETGLPSGGHKPLVLAVRELESSRSSCRSKELWLERQQARKLSDWDKRALANHQVTLENEQRSLEAIELIVKDLTPLSSEATQKEAEDYLNDPERRLIQAAYRGDLDEVKTLLDAGADVNSLDEEGATALIQACMQGHPAIVKVLVEAGADLEKRKGAYQTPISYACSDSKHEILTYLIDRGADTSFEDQYGVTLLLGAARYGHPKVLRTFLDLGLPREDRDGRGIVAYYEDYKRLRINHARITKEEFIDEVGPVLREFGILPAEDAD